MECNPLIRAPIEREREKEREFLLRLFSVWINTEDQNSSLDFVLIEAFWQKTTTTTTAANGLKKKKTGKRDRGLESDCISFEYVVVVVVVDRISSWVERFRVHS